MFKKLLIILVVLAVLFVVYFFFFQAKIANHQPTSTFNNSNLNVQIRDMSQVPAEYFSGNSHFSQGECQTDSDCFIAGCSSELCTNQVDTMTSCHVKNNQPDRNYFACGCIINKCGWYLK